MKNVKDLYCEWLNSKLIDTETKKELSAIPSEAEIKDRFYKELEFGTGGMRGLMGAGINRINRFTIRRATRGLAAFLLAKYPEAAVENGVTIAYDTRNHSRDYAEEAALTLCSEGIRVFLFDSAMPTPVLSFAVVHLACVAGIVITASHNPKEYNGYKVYDKQGVQLVPAAAKELTKCITAFPVLDEYVPVSVQQALRTDVLHYVGSDVLEPFLNAVELQSLPVNSLAKSALKIIYTPLNGTGKVPVCEILKKDGFAQVVGVAEQEAPDGDFPTLRSPNPEDAAALSLAIEQAKKTGADIVLGTDPDCDRVGVAVRHDGEYVLLTGNQIGALLVSAVLRAKQSKGELGPNSVMLKTIVTNELGAEIARDYGLQVWDTLTGFKYIGEQITQIEQNGTNNFVMGYEESYGYLVGTHARDKDAVVAAMLICETAADQLQNGQTLLDSLNKLYCKYGYYLDALDSYTRMGADGILKIQKTMNQLREEKSALFHDIIGFKDYKLGLEGLPPSDVVKFIFEDGSWLAARPSGTEPKIKFYYSIRAANTTLAEIRLQKLRKTIQEVVPE